MQGREQAGRGPRIAFIQLSSAMLCDERMSHAHSVFHYSPGLCCENNAVAQKAKPAASCILAQAWGCKEIPSQDEALMVASHLHLVASRWAQEGDIKVEVGRLRHTAVIEGASWRQPHCELQQICTDNKTAVSGRFGRLHHESSVTETAPIGVLLTVLRNVLMNAPMLPGMQHAALHVL